MKSYFRFLPVFWLVLKILTSSANLAKVTLIHNNNNKNTVHWYCAITLRFYARHSYLANRLGLEMILKIKDSIEGLCRGVSGREFQSLGPTTLKAPPALGVDLCSSSGLCDDVPERSVYVYKVAGHYECFPHASNHLSIVFTVYDSHYLHSYCR